jgi:hypothetical protein
VAPLSRAVLLNVADRGQSKQAADAGRIQGVLGRQDCGHENQPSREQRRPCHDRNPLARHDGIVNVFAHRYAPRKYPDS